MRFLLQRLTSKTNVWVSNSCVFMLKLSFTAAELLLVNTCENITSGLTVVVAPSANSLGASTLSTTVRLAGGKNIKTNHSIVRFKSTMHAPGVVVKIKSRHVRLVSNRVCFRVRAKANVMYRGCRCTTAHAPCWFVRTRGILQVVRRSEA